jgi:hypothetical protein
MLSIDPSTSHPLLLFPVHCGKFAEPEDKMAGSPQLPNEFFTLQSMLTLTGATGIVFVVANGLKVAFDFNPKWLGLALAEIVALLGIVFSGGHGLDYFIGVINGFLIFSAAAGVSSMGGAPAPASKGAVADAAALKKGEAPSRRRFVSSWF